MTQPDKVTQKIPGYPTIKFFGLNKTAPGIDYMGARKTADLVKQAEEWSFTPEELAQLKKVELEKKTAEAKKKMIWLDKVSSINGPP